MTTRERWIVYPLLFLTLGLVLREKFLPPNPRFMQPGVNARKVQCLELECRDLKIAGPDGNLRIRLGGSANRAGQLEIYGRDETMVALAGADDTGRSGMVETFTTAGAPQVQIRSTEQGGLVTAFDASQKIGVILGHEDQRAGVWALLFDVDRCVRLSTLPQGFVDAVREAAQSQPDQPAPEQSPPPKPAEQVPPKKHPPETPGQDHWGRRSPGRTSGSPNGVLLVGFPLSSGRVRTVLTVLSRGACQKCGL